MCLASSFFRRNNFVVRRITTSGRDLPKNSDKLVQDFLNECKQKFQLDNFNLDAVLNMDETSIYLDAPGKLKNTF